MPVDFVPGNPKRKKAAPDTKWRTVSQERVYSQRLLEALKSTKNASQPLNLAPSRAIKEAADSALAMTAKGQTRWSRAILSRRWRRRRLLLKAGGKIRRCSSTRPKAGKPARPVQPAEPRKEEKVENRLRVLARLVPGCRKASTPNLLEETADYVAALEMQVRAMRTLADLLSTATLSSPPPPAES